MKNLKEGAVQGERSFGREFLFPIILFLVAIFIVISVTVYFDHFSNRQNIDLLRQSARKAVVECYAIEGSYPADIEYLEEHYGLEYNHDKYFIDYEVFASNVMPNLDVYERK